jgi:hypothetical protein
MDKKKMRWRAEERPSYTLRDPPTGHSFLLPTELELDQRMEPEGEKSKREASTSYSGACCYGRA